MNTFHKEKTRFVELNREILLSPYKTETNWHIITGAPCSGKTTIINNLAGLGYNIVPEVARIYIEKVMTEELSQHPIFENGVTLQRRILDLQIQMENKLTPYEELFLDSAIPASLAWYRIFGMDPNEMLPMCFLYHYASIFVLEPLPFQSDCERVDEVSTYRNILDEWLMSDFTALGYLVTRVPVLAPKERLSFILDNLPNHG